MSKRSLSDELELALERFKPMKDGIVWENSGFGWDAVLYERGRSVNKINYGLKKKPTAAQKRSAERSFARGLTSPGKSEGKRRMRRL